MKARLIVKTGEFKGATFEVAGSVIIGRAEDNEVYLPSDLISSKHARIILDESANVFFLEDLGSLNGTELDGVRLASRERLDRLHVIRLSGAVDLIWQGAALVADQTTDGDGTSRKAVDRVTLTERLPAIPPTPLARAQSKPEPPVEAVASPRPRSHGLPQSPAQQESGLDTISEGTAIDLKAILRGPDFAGFMQEAKPLRSAGEVDDGVGSAQPKDASAPIASLALCVVEGATKRCYVLEQGENWVGNDPDARVALFHHSVRTEHAVLSVAGARVVLRDPNGTGETTVDGQAFSGEIEVAIGSVIRFGEVAVSIERPE